MRVSMENSQLYWLSLGWKVVEGVEGRGRGVVRIKTHLVLRLELKMGTIITCLWLVEDLYEQLKQFVPFSHYMFGGILSTG